MVFHLVRNIKEGLFRPSFLLKLRLWYHFKTLMSMSIARFYPVLRKLSFGRSLGGALGGALGGSPTIAGLVAANVNRCDIDELIS